MKLLTASQIREWDLYTIEHSGITSIDLMERAASVCADKIQALFWDHPEFNTVEVFCGPGNNGGDGLVIARKLSQQQIPVTVYIMDSRKTSPEFSFNLNRLPPSVKLVPLEESELQQLILNPSVLVVDALFGSGLSRRLEGIYAQVVDRINVAGAFVVSVDIPSGLPSELIDIEYLQGVSIVEADITYTFQVLKQSFLYPETFDFVGNVEVLDIGLHPEFPRKVQSSVELIDTDQIKAIYLPREKFGHKGTFGHVLMVAGSYGKLGAAILSSKAALRAGCGLVTSFVPKVGFTVLQTALPEVMVQTDDELFEIRNFPETDKYAAIGLGPGLGSHPYTQKSMAKWLPQIHQPIVLDADALNMCASYLQDVSFRFPKQCIITPHPKEFDRLAGPSHSSFEREQKQMAFAKKHQIVVVLKGAYTRIALPDGRLYVNSSGNVALATAGSGDVLTGIITGLLAQSYPPEQAAVLGVYLHGICADMWVSRGNQTMIASDIIEMIPQAFDRIFN